MDHVDVDCAQYCVRAPVALPGTCCGNSAAALEQHAR